MLAKNSFGGRNQLKPHTLRLVKNSMFPRSNEKKEIRRAHLAASKNPSLPDFRQQVQFLPQSGVWTRERRRLSAFAGYQLARAGVAAGTAKQLFRSKGADKRGLGTKTAARHRAKRRNKKKRMPPGVR